MALPQCLSAWDPTRRLRNRWLARSRRDGEVYRARDTKLHRDVALKILPASFATDPDRLARFAREAQVLAALNHPNIAAIYHVEDADGVTALVMELVEGETPADRIARGAIPIDEPNDHSERTSGSSPIGNVR